MGHKTGTEIFWISIKLVTVKTKDNFLTVFLHSSKIQFFNRKINNNCEKGWKFLWDAFSNTDMLFEENMKPETKIIHSLQRKRQVFDGDMSDDDDDFC